MPRIELIPEVYYQPNDPYHWEVDNLPLRNIIRRQDLINLALDNVIVQMTDAIGTQGSLSNRLNQSIDADGNLKTAAIDEALHSIEEHADTDDFVRMTRDQSDKLDLIADEATNFGLLVNSDGSNLVLFEAGYVRVEPSNTVTPRVEAPNILKFDFAFPASAAHQHFYGLVPVHVNLVTPDYIHYKVNSVATPFIDGSLRVFINGIRIFEDAEVYVPGALITDPWTLLSFTPDYVNGLFELSAAISDDDIIRVDFEISLV
jgi:hypothetical protein